MTLEKERITIGVFAGSSDAQLVLQELKACNFPMHKVSVIARNAEEQSDIAGVDVKEHTSNTSSQDAAGAVTAGALDGLTGLLVGLVLWAIPGIGSVILAGAEATAIATNLANLATNLTVGLPALLLSLGIPQGQTQGYSDIVCKGYYLVIVTGVDIEITLAKRVFNRCDIQQWGVYEPYSTPISRYKYAVGVFYTCQDAQRAITELRSSGFPMSQVSIVSENVTKLNDINQVNISSSQDDYTDLGIPDDLVRYYQHHLSLDNYLVALKGTDIYIAGARAILESNKIKHFTIYSQAEADGVMSDRQVITNF